MGGSAWYMYPHEFALIEVFALLVIIPIGLLFDLGCHHVLKLVKKSAFLYDGSDIEAEFSRGFKCERKHHKQLSVVLVTRMGVEFMTLGFLALIIFVSEARGLFDALSHIRGCSDYHPGHEEEEEDASEDPCFHLPQTGQDWFHMAELAHFSLFLGMCLYQVLMMGFVQGSVREIRTWQRIRRRDVRQEIRMSKVWADRGRMPSMLGHLHDEDQFRSMQEKFIDTVIQHQKANGDFRHQLLQRCGIDEEEAGEHHALQELLQRVLRGRAFDFAAYLAFSVEDAVSETVEVHSLSWCVVWLYLLVSWPLHRLAGLTLPDVVLILLVVPTCLWLLGCLRLFRAQQRSLAKRRLGRLPSGELSAASLPGSGVKLWWLQGNRLMRCAQVICLIVSYALARMVFNQAVWHIADLHLYITIAATVVLVTLWVGLMLWLRLHAPIFLGLMSLPPYFNQTNAKAMNNFWSAFSFELKCDHAPEQQQIVRSVSSSPAQSDDCTPRVAPENASAAPGSHSRRPSYDLGTSVLGDSRRPSFATAAGDARRASKDLAALAALVVGDARRPSKDLASLVAGDARRPSYDLVASRAVLAL